MCFSSEVLFWSTLSSLFSVHPVFIQEKEWYGSETRRSRTRSCVKLCERRRGIRRKKKRRAAGLSGTYSLFLSFPQWMNPNFVASIEETAGRRRTRFDTRREVTSRDTKWARSGTTREEGKSGEEAAHTVLDREEETTGGTIDPLSSCLYFTSRLWPDEVIWEKDWRQFFLSTRIATGVHSFCRLWDFKRKSFEEDKVLVLVSNSIFVKLSTEFKWQRNFLLLNKKDLQVSHLHLWCYKWFNALLLCWSRFKGSPSLSFLFVVASNEMLFLDWHSTASQDSFLLKRLKIFVPLNPLLPHLLEPHEASSLVADLDIFLFKSCDGKDYFYFDVSISCLRSIICQLEMLLESRMKQGLFHCKTMLTKGEKS